MKLVAMTLLLGMGVAAGMAVGADERDPAPAPIDQDFCTRRDITPQQYQEKCVIKNGPPHRHVLRRQGSVGSQIAPTPATPAMGAPAPTP
jgi:hypothetical protein